MGGRQKDTSPTEPFTCVLIVDSAFLLQSERVLSFVPPDGHFQLISYQIGSQQYVHKGGGVAGERWEGRGGRVEGRGREIEGKRSANEPTVSSL